MYRPLLEKTKGTNEGKSQVLSRFFHLYQCTSENDFHLHGIFLSYIGASGGTRINTGFLAHLYISLSQARGQRVLCCPKRGTYVPPFFEVWEGRTYGSRLPPRSVLNGAHRAPGPPAPLGDRRAPVSPAGSVGAERLPPANCALQPAAFEKAGKTFTCLHPTCVEGPALGSRKKAACPVRPRTQARAFGLASLSQLRRLKAPCAT